MRRLADRSICTAALAAVFALAACERARPVYESREKPAEIDSGAIAIGTFGSMTGRYAFAGVQAHLGLQLAIDERNARGGIQDRPLALQVYDDQGRVDAAARAGERLALVDKAVLVFGGSDDERTISAAKTSEDAPIVCAPCSAAAQTRAGVFALGLSRDDRARALADIAGRTLNAKTVGVVVRENKADDDALAQAFVKEFKALGGRDASVVVAVQAKLEATFAPWKTAAPDAVLFACEGRDAATLARALRAREVHAPLVLAVAPDAESLAEDELRAIESAYAVSTIDPEFAEATAKKFAESFCARFAGRLADESAWLGYEAGVFALDALAKTKSFRAADVRAALAAAQHPVRRALAIQLKSGAWRLAATREGRL